MTVALLENSYIPNSAAETERFRRFLLERNCDVRTISADGLCEQSLCGVSLLVVLGGDGTVLSAVPHTAPLGVPLLGINFGRLGFLSAVEADEAETALSAVAAGNFFCDDRMLLSVSDGKTTSLALNEIVVSRGTRSRPINLEVTIDGLLLDKYCADGIIVSTPTGSTAYSLSAGGPILENGINAVVVTPICPHTLNARPLVVGSEHDFRIRLTAPTDSAALSVDGNNLTDSFCGELSILKTPYYQRFVRVGKDSFFDRLVKKLRDWNN